MGRYSIAILLIFYLSKATNDIGLPKKAHGKSHDIRRDVILYAIIQKMYKKKINMNRKIKKLIHTAEYNPFIFVPRKIKIKLLYTFPG